MAFLNQNKGFTVKTPLSFAHNFLEKKPCFGNCFWKMAVFEHFGKNMQCC